MQIDPEFSSAKADETALAHMAANGSGEAFTALVERLVPTMKAFAARYRNVPGLDAEDLVQEGLLGLLSAVHAYDEAQGTFSAFATACIRNRMVSAIRRNLPAGMHEAADAEETLSMLPSGQADPAQLLVQQEEIARLRVQLQETLTALEYRVLIAYLGGQSYKEIAAHTAVSEKAVDNALQRVRQKLSSGSFHWFSFWQ